MKGTITKSLALWVRARAGQESWERIVAVSDAGSDTELLELISSDIPDALVGRLFAQTSKELGLTEEEICDGFGEYWCCEYAPSVYPSVLGRFKTARDMIVSMDNVHVAVTAAMHNARPPRFVYRWPSEKTLVVRYTSARNMVNLYVGLVRGVGLYFKTPLRVRRLGGNDVEIVFP